MITAEEARALVSKVPHSIIREIQLAATRDALSFTFVKKDLFDDAIRKELADNGFRIVEPEEWPEEYLIDWVEDKIVKK